MKVDSKNFGEFKNLKSENQEREEMKEAIYNSIFDEQGYRSLKQFDQKYEYYIQNMFFGEAYNVINCSNNDENKETLIYILGDAIEPLLFCILKWRPKTLILAVAEQYPNGDDAKTRFEYINHLVNEIREAQFDKGNEKDKEFIDEVRGIFKNITIRDEYISIDLKGSELLVELNKVIGEHIKENIIIDITGGKKSMSAQAFLLAAYSNIDISYVDFKEYNSDLQRPLGVDVEVGKLENPYKYNALREWELIKKCFDNYQFNEVGMLLDQLNNSEYILEQVKNGINKLKKTMKIYEKWDSLDWSNIKIDEEMKNMSLPYSLKNLIDKENKSLLIDYNAIKTGYINQADTECKKKGSYTIVKSFSEELKQYKNKTKNILKNNNIKVYQICEEFCKAKRLCNIYNEYKQAIILCSAICEQIIQEVVEGTEFKVKGDSDDTIREKLRNSINDKGVAWQRSFLFFGKGKVKENKNNEYVQVYIDKTINISNLIGTYNKENPRSDKSEIFFDLITIAEVRNTLVHSNLGLTKDFTEDILNATEQFVIRYCEYRNCREYIDDNEKSIKEFTPDWDELIKMCGLDGLIIN